MSNWTQFSIESLQGEIDRRREQIDDIEDVIHSLELEIAGRPETRAKRQAEWDNMTPEQKAWRSMITTMVMEHSVDACKLAQFAEQSPKGEAKTIKFFRE